MQYVAPIDHMRLLLEQRGALPRLRGYAPFAEVSPDLVEAVLQAAATFAGQVLAPLAAAGDREGAALTPAGVRAPAGFRDAYRRFVADGWASLAGPRQAGGQGMPFLLAAAVAEMWAGANLAFALCPELGLGAVEALERHGSRALKERWLGRLVSGEWCGTMCLTEPQAGTDLASVQTRAEPHGDAYRLFGRKIFITWGEHDLAENIVHLVLARLPDAPAGVKGLSLFLVPRRIPNPDDSPGAANDVRALAIERKMGIHASPTCTLAFGDAGGAVGWLVGAPHEGLSAMFTMMNNMRVGVGIQGVGIAERAWQIAARYANERVQGRGADGQPATIVHHTDVRRMLLTMKSLTMAARGLAYAVAAAIDVANHATSAAERRAGLARAELLTPVVKAWCTEVGIEVTSLGVQVLGGAGYTEDAGAAQCYRDARITAIYEGTNSIQAQDLLGRKIPRDGGRELAALLDEMSATASAVRPVDRRLVALAARLRAAIERVRATTTAVLAAAREDPQYIGSVAVNYLLLLGYTCGAWQWLLAAASATEAASEGEARVVALTPGLLDAADFYGAYVLPRAALHAELVAAGSGPIAAAHAERL